LNGEILPTQETTATAKNMNTEIQRSGVMRKARRKLQLTQLALARRVGCTESLITKIETGRSIAQAELREAIARDLNIHTWEVGE
jgi:ribosome-binding protein aMBF1 (putative translation factor)